MTDHKIIAEFLERSRNVLRDCALENGAVVAANTDKAYTPRAAADYRSVWPRDAAFVCAAAKVLGYPEIGERFFAWLEEKPEGFANEQLLYQKYSTNGRKQGWQFQPDQMGTLLWLLGSFTDGDAKAAKRWEMLIARLADGIVKVWNGNFFTIHVVDLWEQEHLHTTWTMGNNFTYTLAACARGLLSAHKLFPHVAWAKAAAEMQKKIDESYSAADGYFLRNHGTVDDTNIDASLLGLVWPYALYTPDDERMRNTVAAIEQTLVHGGGVHRFQFDYYDGEGSAQEGGGAWPILNFWMTQYWVQAGNRAKAQEYFFWVLHRVGADEKKYHGYLPEQLFDDVRIGIYPLAWSHAMFVLAADALELLP